MRNRQLIFVGAIVMMFALVSGAALFAQSSTQEPSLDATSEASSFNDNRINGDIYLGGLALYCTDEMGNTDGNTFQNGTLQVWGVGGQQYIVLTADQLRGTEEIPQPVGTMEAGMDMSMTDEPMMSNPSAEATNEAGLFMEPVLLAQANTPNGAIWFYSFGNDTFSLQGTDEYGKFYTYTWTGCALGSLSTDTEPFDGSMATTGMMMTAEVSPVATLGAGFETATPEVTTP